MAKVELLEYPNGQYAIRRTKRFLFFKKIEFFDLQDKVWRRDDSSYLRSCFVGDYFAARDRYVWLGAATGIPAKQNNVLSISEFNAMNDLAETDPGMKDLLEQAKAFYVLKKG